MALQIEGIQRVFMHGEQELTDPGSDLDPKGVRDFYASAYPEITNAGVQGPDIEEREGGRVAVYRFSENVGRHG